MGMSLGGESLYQEYTLFNPKLKKQKHKKSFTT